MVKSCIYLELGGSFGLVNFLIYSLLAGENLNESSLSCCDNSFNFSKEKKPSPFYLVIALMIDPLLFDRLLNAIINISLCSK